MRQYLFLAAAIAVAAHYALEGSLMWALVMLVNIVLYPVARWYAGHLHSEPDGSSARLAPIVPGPERRPAH